MHQTVTIALISTALSGDALAQDVHEIFQRVSSHYASVEGVRIQIRWMNPTARGDGVQRTGEEQVLYVQRPNRFSMSMEYSDGRRLRRRVLMSDHNHFFAYSNWTGDDLYTQSEAPRTFAELRPRLTISAMVSGTAEGPVEAAKIAEWPHLLALDLLSLPDGRLLNEDRTMEYIGQAEVSNCQSHRIRVSAPQVDVDLWVAEGEQPWVLRAKTSLKESEIYEFLWDPEADLSGVFEFTPPEGAEEVDSLQAALKEQVIEQTRDRMIEQQRDNGEDDGHAEGRPPEPEMRFEPVWSKNGLFSGVGVAEDRVFAMSHDGALVLDGAGERVAVLPVRAHGHHVLTAQLDEDDGVELITYEAVWSRQARAWDDDGEPLWAYGSANAIDNAAAGDLDGDGVDEIAIGHNGPGGLHLVSADGERQWTNQEIGNVWHVSIGPIDDDGQRGIVTTSSTGQVHLFNSEGEKLRDLDAGGSANFVRVAGGEKQPLIIADVDHPKWLIGMTLEGEQRWRIRLGPKFIDSGRISPDGSRIALSLQQGEITEVTVWETATGRRLASSPMRGDVAWIDRGDEDLLVVTNGRKVQALRVVEKDED